MRENPWFSLISDEIGSYCVFYSKRELQERDEMCYFLCRGVGCRRPPHLPKILVYWQCNLGGVEGLLAGMAVMKHRSATITREYVSFFLERINESRMRFCRCSVFDRRRL